MSEIRHNLLTGEWAVIAPERAKRPGDLAKGKARPEIPAYQESCPFCRGNEHLTTEERFRLTADDGSWLIRSVPNKFSVLSPVGDVSPRSEPLGDVVSGVGLHEVIVETPLHNRPLALFHPAHAEKLVWTYRERVRAFYADPRIRHVILFKNHGEESGASLQHPHSQVVGLPIVPGQVLERADAALHYQLENGDCLVCRMIAEERRTGARLVAENDAFIAFIPFAALSPFHVWIFPKAHAACFATLEDGQIEPLTRLLQAVLGKIYAALDNPAFNFVVRSLAVKDAKAGYFHWYISIIPRVGKAAGFELGTGMYINSSHPEASAALLREATPPLPPDQP
ncbi:MAG TPA: galactose-1-phosphate uridylyltransferase [Candidatus Ozemobacteraceae bacterium]